MSLLPPPRWGRLSLTISTAGFDWDKVPTAPYVGMTAGRRAAVSFDADPGTGCWQHEVFAGHLGRAVTVWSLLLQPDVECPH